MSSPNSIPIPIKAPQPGPPGKIKQAVEGPILPVLLMMAGGYLLWFGVHYWRSDVKWPTDPIKAVLTGKPIPAAVNTSDQGAIKTYERLLGPGPNATPEIAAHPGTGETNVTGAAESRIAAAALKYVGAGYVFGGPADKIGDWDCSSYVSYVLGHDLGIGLPGGKWGDPGFPPHAHGPTTLNYLLYGAPINRSDVSPGDLVVWNTHMGIATGNNQIVAARTPATGTGLSGIDSVTNELGETPHFRRVQG